MSPIDVEALRTRVFAEPYQSLSDDEYACLKTWLSRLKKTIGGQITERDPASSNRNAFIIYDQQHVDAVQTALGFNDARRHRISAEATAPATIGAKIVAQLEQVMARARERTKAESTSANVRNTEPTIAARYKPPNCPTCGGKRRVVQGPKGGRTRRVLCPDCNKTTKVAIGPG